MAGEIEDEHWQLQIFTSSFCEGSCTCLVNESCGEWALLERYWNGMRLPLLLDSGERLQMGILLFSSESITGNGFFFDPTAWLAVVAIIVFISVLMWVPMVLHITRPLSRMAEVTSQMAEGNFKVDLPQSRRDEIGLLAYQIKNMAGRLHTLVNGQKRFLSDVAHELGTPIARIQFGLGALEQRVPSENVPRIKSVMDDASQLSQLVEELLDFSRTEIHGEAVTLSRVNLLQLVQRAVRLEVPQHTLVHVFIDDGLNVAASPKLLLRAIANILRNSLNYAGAKRPITIRA